MDIIISAFLLKIYDLLSFEFKCVKVFFENSSAAFKMLMLKSAAIFIYFQGEEVFCDYFWQNGLGN
jgi:hypothetical protein